MDHHSVMAREEEESLETSEQGIPRCVLKSKLSASIVSSEVQCCRRVKEIGKFVKRTRRPESNSSPHKGLQMNIGGTILLSKFTREKKRTLLPLQDIKYLSPSNVQLQDPSVCCTFLQYLPANGGLNSKSLQLDSQICSKTVPRSKQFQEGNIPVRVVIVPSCRETSPPNKISLCNCPPFFGDKTETEQIF